ncbi:hypothetical protein RTP6_007356 [Batrachochytrium dendrobatidis]
MLQRKSTKTAATTNHQSPQCESTRTTAKLQLPVACSYTEPVWDLFAYISAETYSFLLCIVADFQRHSTDSASDCIHDDKIAAMLRDIARMLPIQTVFCKILESWADSCDFVETPDCSQRSKSCTIAAECKDAANKSWKKGIRQNALIGWSQGLRFAGTHRHDCSKPEIAGILYANRSLVFFSAKLYEHAYLDIRRALMCGYPTDSMHKLLRRKALCIKHLGTQSGYEDAELVLYEALDASRRVKNIEFQQTIIKDLQNLALQSASKNDSTTAEVSSNFVLLPCSTETTAISQTPSTGKPTTKQDFESTTQDKQSNGNIRSADACLLHKNETGELESLMDTATKEILPSIKPPEIKPFVHPKIEVAYLNGDRSVIASQDIKAGEVLLVEAPIAWVVSRTCRGEYCAFCFRRASVHGIYCPDCAFDEPYCSEMCRSKMQSLHAKECGNRSIQQMDDHTLLALRLSRIVCESRSTPNLCTMNFWPTIQQRITTKTKAPGFTQSGVYMDDIKALKYLASNITKIDKVDVLMASLKVLLLEQAITDTKDRLDRSMLMRLMMQISCNCIGISTTCFDHSDMDEEITSQREIRTGSGIYPTASLINHSCEPTALVYFQASHLYIRASKNIRKGNAITISYGESAGRSLRATRQQNLKAGWGFECRCSACISEDDTKDRQLAGLKCPGCPYPLYEGEPRCPKCHSIVDISRQQKVMAKIDAVWHECQDHRKHDNVASLIQTLQGIQTDLESIMHPSSSRLGCMYDNLASLNVQLAKQGDNRILLSWCEKLLESSIRIVEGIFGLTSIEAANEHNKMAYFMMAVDAEKGIKIARHAEGLFRTLYGDQCREIFQLHGIIAVMQKTLGIPYCKLDIARNMRELELAEMGFN